MNFRRLNSVLAAVISLFLLGGCANQPEAENASLAFGAFSGPAPAFMTAADVSTIGFVQSEMSVRMETLNLVARPIGPVVLPQPAAAIREREVSQPVFFLGAGDALGEQIFITYVAALRAEEAYVTGESAFPRE